MSFNCSICFEDIQEQEICSLECNHQFCKNCIDNILKTNNKKCANYTQLLNLLNDESYNVIIYNYEQNTKCMLSEFSYDKCFNLFNR